MMAGDTAEDGQASKHGESVLAETQTAGFGFANGKVVDRLLLDFDRDTPAARIRRERVSHPDPMRDGDVHRESRGTMVVNPHDTHRDQEKLELGTSHGRDRVIAEWNDYAPRAYLRHERLEDGDWIQQAAWELHPVQGIEQVGGELVPDGGENDEQLVTCKNCGDEHYRHERTHRAASSFCPNCRMRGGYILNDKQEGEFVTDGGCKVDASAFADYGFPAPDVMARGSDAQHRVWRVLEKQGDATIQEVVDETGLSYQTAGRYLRLFEAVCPSVSKRPFFEDARITVFDLESEGGDADA